MFYEFAPMEGITTCAVRNAHHEIFGGADRYYAPFITTGRSFLTRTRDRRDIDPASNRSVTLIPQLLSNNSADFLNASQQLAQMGYREINLNLGYPSATVVTKHRGAGFLEDPDDLDRFFEDVFTSLPSLAGRTGADIRISAKTRLGISDPEEAFELMKVFNRYPLSLLIIHPRVQREQYRGQVHTDIFLDMSRDAVMPVCYNGDIQTPADLADLLGRIRRIESPQDAAAKTRRTGASPHGSRGRSGIAGVMIGRGAIRNPAIFRMLRHGPSPNADEIRRYLDLALANTAEGIPEPANQLAKMKDLWSFLGSLFAGDSRYLKKIRKARSLEEYRTAVEILLAECDLLPE